jgi:predicted Zn finger-like uncharacterized protein
MSTSVQLSDDLQTTCLHCGSVFRISAEQLEMARGQARCSQCMQVFNALFSLENFSGHYEEPDFSASATTVQSQASAAIQDLSAHPEERLGSSVSLNEAMFGEDHKSSHSLKPVLWLTGILLLLIMSIVQLIYYQRYPLLSSQYQQQILQLCNFLPCDDSRFTSLSQINLIERNVFSHPTRDKALMISGSFINRASFSQPLPELLISLSDLNGNLIGNRQFIADEYLIDKSIKNIAEGEAIQFRLEILDPGARALTYEFEFL